MEEMIKQITKIDQEVYLKKINSEEEIKQAESRLNDKLHKAAQTIIDKAQKEAKEKYEQEIQQQVELLKIKKIKTHEIIKQIGIRYKETEEEISQELFECIFSLEE